MSKKVYMIVCLNLFYIMVSVSAAEPVTGSAFGAEICSPPAGMCVRYRSEPSCQPQSFYALVTAPVLKDLSFADQKKHNCFGDINTRYIRHTQSREGANVKIHLTPLHMLVERPDATLFQVKALLNYGAKANIPALVQINGQNQAWSSHKIGLNNTGASPIQADDGKKLNLYLGNPTVVGYIFDEMIEQAIKEKIQQAECENRLEVVDNETGVIILPRACVQHSWPEMGDDEALEFLQKSVEDQREFEAFVQSLEAGAFEVFLKMQEYYVV